MTEQLKNNSEPKIKLVDLDTVIISVPKIAGGNKDLTFAYIPTLDDSDSEIKTEDTQFFWPYFQYIPDNSVVHMTESARKTIITESPKEILERADPNFPIANDPNIFTGGVHVLRWHRLNNKKSLTDDERITRIYNKIPSGNPMVLPSELGITEQMYDRAHHLAFNAFVADYKKRKGLK